MDNTSIARKTPAADGHAAGQRLPAFRLVNVVFNTGRVGFHGQMRLTMRGDTLKGRLEREGGFLSVRPLADAAFLSKVFLIIVTAYLFI